MHASVWRLTLQLPITRTSYSLARRPLGTSIVSASFRDACFGSSHGEQNAHEGREYGSKALAAAHETALSLREICVINKRTAADV